MPDLACADNREFIYRTMRRVMAHRTEEAILRETTLFGANLEHIVRFEARNVPIPLCIHCDLSAGLEIAVKCPKLETEDLPALVLHPVDFERGKLFHTV